MLYAKSAKEARRQLAKWSALDIIGQSGASGRYWIDDDLKAPILSVEYER